MRPRLVENPGGREAGGDETKKTRGRAMESRRT